MSSPFDTFLYIDDLHNWRNLRTGRMVSGAVIQAEVEAHTVASQNLLEELTRRLFSGEIDTARWKMATASELKNAHIAYSMFGAGGRDNMTQASWGRVGGTLKDEFKWLQSFADDIATKNISEAQALARVKQYGNSASQSYWREYCAEQSTEANDPDLPLLTHRPRDGGTQCRGNCNCEIVVTDGQAHWQMNAGENCDDCQGLSDGGPYRLA